MQVTKVAEALEILRVRSKREKAGRLNESEVKGFDRNESLRLNLVIERKAKLSLIRLSQNGK